MISRALASSLLLLPIYLGVSATLLYRTAESAASLSVSDSVEYALGAQNLATDGRYQLRIDGTAHPPRYQPGFSLLFLAPVYWWTLDADGNPENLGYGIFPVLLSALVTLTIVFFLCRRLLPSTLGVAAAALALLGLLEVHWFYTESREVMSDVPCLMLGFLALLLFLRARDRPATALFAGAGILAALAGSMRMTGFALCLPFAWLLLRDVRNAGGRVVRIVALFAPVALSLAAILAYNAKTFGEPFYTGYHYWLPPVSFRLSPRHVFFNLIELPQPFLPPHHARAKGSVLIGFLFVILAVWLGRRVRRHRPELWERTRGILAFLGLAAMPVVAFHLFYPYYSARFALLANVLAVLLVVVWLVGLLDRLPRPVWAGFAVLAVLLCFVARPPDRIGRDWYNRQAIEKLDRLLPEDAVFINMFNVMYVDAAMMRGTRRLYVPLNDRTLFRDWLIGYPDEPRRPLFEWSAAESPERVRALLEAGRPVYAELLQPGWSGEQDSLDGLLARFETVPIRTELRQPVWSRPLDSWDDLLAHFETTTAWHTFETETLVELRLRPGEPKGDGAQSGPEPRSGESISDDSPAATP